MTEQEKEIVDAIVRQVQHILNTHIGKEQAIKLGDLCLEWYFKGIIHAKEILREVLNEEKSK